jgi:hypothetical protein
MFLGLKEGVTYVKMEKLGKKKSLVSTWEGPFLFLNYFDDNGFMGQDEGVECVLLKARRNNFGTDLDEICSYSILHKLCEN